MENEHNPNIFMIFPILVLAFCWNLSKTRKLVKHMHSVYSHRDLYNFFVWKKHSYYFPKNYYNYWTQNFTWKATLLLLVVSNISFLVIILLCILLNFYARHPDIWTPKLRRLTSCALHKVKQEIFLYFSICHKDSNDNTLISFWKYF